VVAAAFSAGSPEAHDDGRVLVIYTADWCKPCQRLKKDIEKNPEVLGGVGIEWRDGAEVETVPDIRLMDGDRVIRRKVGYTDLKSFAEWLNADLL
jgi:thiol-disulfide isomerase/thioredoxin